MFPYIYKFYKVDLNNYQNQILKTLGLFCNNPNKDVAYKIIYNYFGKPNANTFRDNDSTWKYILKYEKIFLSLYDFRDTWSLGFVELRFIIPDYQVINSIGKMLYEHLIHEMKAISVNTK